MPNKYGNFETAFSAEYTSGDFQCDCGKTYFCPDGRAQEDIDASVAAGEIQTIFLSKIIRFEGKEFSDLCDCWKKRADMIKGFLKTHHRQIITFLNKEREDALEAAQALPVGDYDV